MSFALTKWPFGIHDRLTPMFGTPWLTNRHSMDTIIIITILKLKWKWQWEYDDDEEDHKKETWERLTLALPFVQQWLEYWWASTAALPLPLSVAVGQWHFFFWKSETTEVREREALEWEKRWSFPKHSKNQCPSTVLPFCLWLGLLVWWSFSEIFSCSRSRVSRCSAFSPFLSYPFCFHHITTNEQKRRRPFPTPLPKSNKQDQFTS